MDTKSKIMAWYIENGVGMSDEIFDSLVRLIDSITNDVRTTALESAARIADKHVSKYSLAFGQNEQTRGEIAAAIRALASKPSGAEQGNTATESRYVHAACPCLHTTPCAPNCTCVQPTSSRGCDRCCSYGSIKQQRLQAERLAGQAAQLIEAHAALWLALPILLSDVERLAILYGDFFSVHGNSQQTKKCKELLDTAIAARDAVAEALGEKEK